MVFRKIFNSEIVHRTGSRKEQWCCQLHCLKKSNKWDYTGDVLRFESRQWLLKHREKETRVYNKKIEYWNNTIKVKRKKITLVSQPSQQLQSAEGSLQNDTARTTSCSLLNCPLIDYDKMTIPQLKHLLKAKGIKGISKKSNQELIKLLKSIQ